MSPEIELLVLCARTALRPAQAARAAELAHTGIDWARLVELAQRHGVLPLVSRSLSASSGGLSANSRAPSVDSPSGFSAALREAVPRAVRDQLRAISAGVALRNRAMAAELLQLLEALDRHTVRAIPLKGPVLAETVYRDLALRPCGDLDLLVRRRDTELAARVLLARGFELVPQFHDQQQVRYVRGLRGQRFTRYLQSRSEHHFLRADGQLLVDLHLRLADRFIRFDLDADQLLGRTELVELAGQHIRGLQPEDLLLILCLNGAKDGWSQLLRLCDIAELLRTRPDLDRDLLRARAQHLGVVRLLRISLDLVARLLEAPPAAALLAGLAADPVASQLATRLERRLLADAQPRPQTVNLAYARCLARVRERRVDQAWLFLELALTPGVADWMALRLPPRLWPLYYVVRPLRLACTTVFNRSRLAARSPAVSA